MKDLKDIAFVVSARLNSTRVPQKMIKPFAGSSLLEITIQKILSSKIPKEQFYLSLHEPELKQIANKYQCNVFHRSYESANAETSLQSCYEWWNQLPYKYVVLISACHPLLTVDTINKFVDSYCQSESNGLFSVIKKKNYFWNNNGEMITHWPKGYKIMNTKAVEATYEGGHVLYAGRLDMIGQDVWMGSFQKKGDPELFEIDEQECFDIDYPWQFQVAEILYKQFGKMHKPKTQHQFHVPSSQQIKSSDEFKATVIISGSCGLIGSFIKKRLVDQGVQVVDLDINNPVCPVDATDEYQVGEFFKSLSNNNSGNSGINKIDALINCIGIPNSANKLPHTDLTQVSLESFNQLIDVNLSSVFLIIREFAKYYTDSTIINISSLYSVVSPRLDLYNGHIKHPGYIASKFGLIGLTKYLAVLLADKNISVNCIAPAAVAETIGVDNAFLEKYNKQVPMKRPVSMEEVHNCIEMLMKTRGITGQNLIIDGGYSLW